MIGEGKGQWKFGSIGAESRVKPWSVTQNQAKRISEIALLHNSQRYNGAPCQDSEQAAIVDLGRPSGT
jgi:hypothetical protein